MEEVEYPRVTESLAVSVVDVVQESTKGRSASPTNETAKRRRNHEYHAIEAGCSAAMSVSGTVKSLVVDSHSRWSTSDPLSDCNRHDQNEIIHCNANSEIIDQEICENSTVVNSWVRASMRRLRHLRLPEETERQGSIDSNNCRGTIASAPNSLPDIALIAPEILAAQTNGTTSGTLVRPSSAPVRNTNNSNVVFQRSERQFRGSRSQRIRNREITSRQNSVLSSTTGSDTTVSGTTTYSSSFGGISTSPPSSTTSPQRIASRR